jgi:crossover junction endodeoxyribonuclease RusA
MTHNFVILGKPVSSKNDKGRSSSGATYTPKHIRDWMQSAIRQLKEKYSGDTITDDVAAGFIIYQGARQAIDLDNAISGAMDALERSGIIKNDYQVSEILHTKRLRDRKSPRIEITIQELTKDES